MNLILIRLMRLVLRLLWLFPIEQKSVVLTAYNGRQFGCNPKYLALALCEHKDMKVYYALKKNISIEMPKEIIRIDYHSLRHIWLLMTSKYIVFNSSGFAGILPYRNTQIVINTWHGGGGFKTTGIKIFKTKEQVSYRVISGENTTFFIASSKAFIEDKCKSMLVDKNKFLPVGLPRNDVLFGDHSDIVSKVRKFLGLKGEEKIILYAPTYRDGPVKNLANYGFVPINVKNVIDAINRRFGGKHVFVFKAHHDMLPENNDILIINASNYSDTQELLLAADILITDYSSIQWDFALQKKPGFLYGPDIEDYMNVHPFSSDYRKWPYDIARSNEELIKLIENYDVKKGHKKIEEHFFNAGSYENGTATQQVLKQAFGL